MSKKKLSEEKIKKIMVSSYEKFYGLPVSGMTNRALRYIGKQVFEYVKECYDNNPRTS